MRGRPLTAEQIADIRSRYEAGQSRAVIRQETGFSIWAIEKYTLGMRKQRFVTNRVQERLIALAESGVSARKAAVVVGFSDTTVRAYAGEHFKTHRPSGRDVSRYAQIVEAIERRAPGETCADVARRLGLKNAGTLRVMAHRARALLSEVRA